MFNRREFLQKAGLAAAAVAAGTFLPKVVQAAVAQQRIKKSTEPLLHPIDSQDAHFRKEWEEFRLRRLLRDQFHGTPAVVDQELGYRLPDLRERWDTFVPVFCVENPTAAEREAIRDRYYDLRQRMQQFTPYYAPHVGDDHGLVDGMLFEKFYTCRQHFSGAELQALPFEQAESLFFQHLHALLDALLNRHSFLKSVTGQGYRYHTDFTVHLAAYDLQDPQARRLYSTIYASQGFHEKVQS